MGSLRRRQLLATSAAAALLYLEEQRSNRGGRPSARLRQRRTVKDIHKCLGESYFRRAYRMSYRSFTILHSTIRQDIVKVMVRYRNRSSSNSQNLPPVPNGRISTSVRLAVAIRYFAGGSPYDLQSVYGISHSCVHESVWFVVEAINQHKDFHFSFPESHEEQMKIAQEFKARSAANFDICAGAIDGILIWTHKPTKTDCADLHLGQRKFLCGRKNKFGLNCQAVCDARGRFLDLSICLGGASSDCLAFERSSLYKKLEDGILADGLCLFGDNAYLNTPYMATPYINQQRSSSGARDNYNYYHSQLRITIECAFGMFTQRWGILRSAIPRNIRIQKTISLVSTLAKLHNFCIDMQEGTSGLMVAQDYASLISNPDGYVPLVRTEESIPQLPLALLNGGNHFDDIPRDLPQRRMQNIPELPRQRLCEMVQEQHLVRPRPRATLN